LEAEKEKLREGKNDEEKFSSNSFLEFCHHFFCKKKVTDEGVGELFLFLLIH